MSSKPLFIRKRLQAALRAYRIYWTHRKLAYGWQRLRWIDAVRIALREFMPPEHMAYWR